MHDAVMLDSLGAVAECTGANLFLIVGEQLVTPTTRAALPGITRRTVLEIGGRAGDRGRRARRLARRAALRRRRVRLRLGRRDRPDRLLRRAPGGPARAPVHRRSCRTPTARGRARPNTGPSSTLAFHEAPGRGARAVRAARAAGRTRHRRSRRHAGRRATRSPTASRVTSATSSSPSRASGSAPNGARVVALDRFTRPRGRRVPGAARRVQAPVHAARSAHRPPRRPRQRRLPAHRAADRLRLPLPDRPARLHGRRSTRTTDFAGLPLDVRRGRRGAAQRRVRRLGVDRRRALADRAATARSAAGSCPTTARAAAQARPVPVRRDGDARSAAWPSRPRAASPRAPARSRSAARTSTSARPARAASSGSRSGCCSTTRGRPPSARGEIVTVAPRKNPLESLKGITFNRWDRDDPWIYAGDPFRCS